jgi:hypothetical protein
MDFYESPLEFGESAFFYFEFHVGSEPPRLRVASGPGLNGQTILLYTKYPIWQTEIPFEMHGHELQFSFPADWLRLSGEFSYDLYLQNAQGPPFAIYYGLPGQTIHEPYWLAQQERR